MFLPASTRLVEAGRNVAHSVSNLFQIKFIYYHFLFLEQYIFHIARVLRTESAILQAAVHVGRVHWWSTRHAILHKIRTAKVLGGG